MSKREVFTDLFSHDLVFDQVSRINKAKKIVAILKDSRGRLSKLNCLDVGCSSGIITNFLGGHFAKVIGADVDNLAIKKANQMSNKETNVRFVSSKEKQLPFSDGSFDVVVCNQIYEHVENPNQLFTEICRVLKPDGLCFLGARNKYGGVFDGHYRLPFLSWLPRRVADIYLCLFTSKNEYDINLYSLPRLKKLVDGFVIDDFTLKVIRNPKTFHASDTLPSFPIFNKILVLFASVLYFFIPNYLWILRKKG